MCGKFCVQRLSLCLQEASSSHLSHMVIYYHLHLLLMQTAYHLYFRPIHSQNEPQCTIVAYEAAAFALLGTAMI